MFDYMMDNYNQSVYNRKLCQILKENVESLEKLEFELKKIQFVSATKSGDETTLFFTVWSSKNTANIKKVDLNFNFKEGLSENQLTNEFFSMMSRYVQRREKLQSEG